MRQFGKQYWIILLLLVVGLYRFFLAGNGAMGFHDELRYYKSVLAVKSLENKDIESFCWNLCSTQGRPGDATIRLLPALSQEVLHAWKGTYVEHPQSLLTAQYFNILLSLALLLIFYKITLLLFPGTYNIALFGTLFYSLFANSNIYIRHILPYDSSLLCFLYALYYTLSRPNHSHLSIKDYMVIGWLTAFGFTVYPGYYFFPVLIFSVVLVRDDTALLSKSYLVKCAILGISFASVILFYEVLSRIGNISYLFIANSQSRVVTQGSFEEGFSFLPKYLISVENSAGIIMLVGVTSYLIKAVMGIVKKEKISTHSRNLRLLLIIMAAGYFIHAGASAIFHKMVFLGRLIHMYYPFMVWAVLSFVIDLKSVIVKRWVYIAITASSLLSFTLFSKEYFQIAYPADVLYKYKINRISDNRPFFYNETKEYFNYFSPPQIDPATTNNKKILVNFCLFYPVSEDFRPFVPPLDSKLLYVGQHFLTFPAYTYEGYSIRERMLLGRRNYKVSIFEMK